MMMDRKIKVSVIISVYNAHAYLPQCLDSVVNQTLEDMEAICVDDGSEDQSLEILTGYAQRDPRIRIICQRHGGTAAARNAGLRCAEGEYICFLDGGDMLTPQALQELTETADRKGAELLCFDAETVFACETLEKQYGHLAAKMKRSREYCGIASGRELFRQMYWKQDFRSFAGMHLFRADSLRRSCLRFHERIAHADELFTLRFMMEADAASHVRRAYYVKRIWEGADVCAVTPEESFLGYFTAHAELMRFAMARQFDAEVGKALWHRIMTLKNLAMAKYSQAQDNRHDVLKADPGMQALFMMHRELLDKKSELEKTERELVRAQETVRDKDNALSGMKEKLVQTQEKLKETDGKLVQTREKLKETDGKLVRAWERLKETDGKLVQTREKLKETDGKLVRAWERLKEADRKRIQLRDWLTETERKLDELHSDRVIRIWLKVRGGVRYVKKHGIISAVKRTGRIVRERLKRRRADP